MRASFVDSTPVPITSVCRYSTPGTMSTQVPVNPSGGRWPSPSLATEMNTFVAGGAAADSPWQAQAASARTASGTSWRMIVSRGCPHSLASRRRMHPAAAYVTAPDSTLAQRTRAQRRRVEAPGLAVPHRARGEIADDHHARAVLDRRAVGLARADRVHPVEAQLVLRVVARALDGLRVDVVDEDALGREHAVVARELQVGGVAAHQLGQAVLVAGRAGHD